MLKLRCGLGRHLPLCIAALGLLSGLGRPSFAVEPDRTDSLSGESNDTAEKLTKDWSRVIPVAEPPDAKYGQWRVWVQEGWLVAERRTGDGDIEWKIVLAKVVDDEPPEIVVNRISGGARMLRRARKDGEMVTMAAPGPTGPIPGSLRLSYRDGRYFIRDGMGNLRSLREPKTADGEWPKLDVPPRDANSFGGMGASRSVVLSGQVTKSWITVVAGPQAAVRTVNGRVERTINADCLVRLTHVDLHGGLGFTGSAELPRATCGEWFVIDDGDLLYALKLDAWRLPFALQAQAKRDPALAGRLATEKLAGSPAPELSGNVWLNADGPPTWKSLRGKPVVLVLFDLKQQSFLPLVPPLVALGKMYGNQGLKTIGIHAEAPGEEVEKRLVEERIDFPVLIDDGKAEERFGIGFSACILIDREGNVVSVYKDLLAPPAEIEKLLEDKRH